MTPTYVSRLNPRSIPFPLPIRDKNFKASSSFFFFFFFFSLRYSISQDRRNIIIVRRRPSINNSTDKKIHPCLITFVHFALARHLADEAKNKRVCESLGNSFQRNSLSFLSFSFSFFPHHLFPVPVAEEKPFATVSFFSLMIPTTIVLPACPRKREGGGNIPQATLARYRGKADFWCFTLRTWAGYHRKRDTFCFFYPWN